MPKTLIGNIKGKDGRGISKIEKTATTGSVDTYTITYTDSTQSTYEVRNSDNIAIQRQIVPNAAIESSATASQAYAAGDYLVLNGVLRKAKGAIAKGGVISDSNSTVTTVTGELATHGGSASPTVPPDTVNDYKVFKPFKSPSTGSWNNAFTYKVTRAGLYFIRLGVNYSFSDYGEATFRIYSAPNDGRHELDARLSIEQTAKSAEGINLRYATSEVYRFKQGDSFAVQCYTHHAGFSISEGLQLHLIRIGE